MPRTELQKQILKFVLIAIFTERLGPADSVYGPAIITLPGLQVESFNSKPSTLNTEVFIAKKHHCTI